MPIIQKYIYEWPEGATQLTLEEWVKTLPAIDQKAFLEAKKRQDEITKGHYSSGKIIDQPMTPNQPSYLLKDDESATFVNEAHDDIWIYFFNRYLEENGITFYIVAEAV